MAFSTYRASDSLLPWTITTAPTERQVKDLLWRYVRRLHRKARTKLPGKLLEKRLKIDDEQLDCCPLSFLDVALIKRTFTTSLTNILHARVAYPADDKSKEAKHDADHRSAPAQPGA